jgi:transporter family-2 protein
VFYGISALIGAVTAVMISVNGGLTAVYGVFCATMIIHLVGTAAAFLVLRARGMKLNLKTCGAPAWMYLGGAIGYFTSAFNNLSYGKISFTAIVALGLLGQMATAFFIDTFGLFGMKKVPFRLSVLVGFVCAGLGVAVMLRGARLSARLAVAAAFAAGITLVLSRTVNAGAVPAHRRAAGLAGQSRCGLADFRGGGAGLWPGRNRCSAARGSPRRSGFTSAAPWACWWCSSAT